MIKFTYMRVSLISTSWSPMTTFHDQVVMKRNRCSSYIVKPLSELMDHVED